MEAAISGAAESRSVEANRGITWWTEAWAFFTKNAGMWIVLALILLVAFVVLSFVPVIGPLVGSLVAPVFAGSWMLAARKAEAGTAPDVNDLLAGFKEKLTPLIVLGALLLVATIVIGALAAALGFGAVMGMGGAQGGVGMAMGAGMLALLVGLALGLIVAMAFWFAPALVVFRDMAPVDALKASVAASLKNIVPFLLYSVVYFVAAIVASIPFGLGWVVLVPVLLLTVYVSYKDVFGA